jgi:hypothetical protein
MEFYVWKVLEGYNNLLLANTPATKKLFKEGSKQVVLAEAKKEVSHNVGMFALPVKVCGA